MTALCTSFAFVLALLQIMGFIHVPGLVYALLLLPLAVYLIILFLSVALMALALVVQSFGD